MGKLCVYAGPTPFRIALAVALQVLKAPAQGAEFLLRDALCFGHRRLAHFLAGMFRTGQFTDLRQWLLIRHQAWTCQSVFRQASPRVSRNRSRSSSLLKIASRRSPRFITW